MVLSKDLKIAICFGLIIGAIISFCNMCFASENLSIDYVEGVNFGSDNTFVSASNYIIGYFEIEPGYLYTFQNNQYGRQFGFSNDIPAVGVGYSDFSVIGANENFSFTYSDYSYVYMDYVNGSNLVVTREPLMGMSNFVDNIAYNLSIGNLSSVWVLVVPILAISVLVGLGVYLVRRIINKIKKKKGGI